MNMTLRLVLIALLFAIATTAATAAEGRLTLLSGKSHKSVTVTSITKDRITFTPPEGEKLQADMDDLVGITYPKRTPLYGTPSEDYVEVRLRGGDVVFGTLAESEDEEIALRSRFVGPIRFVLDDVAEIRFVQAWQNAVERPALTGVESEWDVFYYRTLDHVEGTLLRLTRGSVVVQPRIGGTHSIFFETLLMVRFADVPAPELPKGRLAVIRLTDGSRLTLSELTSDGKNIRGTTLRGTKVDLLLADILALYQTGGRFTYLSDLSPEKVEIVPWIGESYAWDRPRTDRSFLDAPLLCGGETFLKGLGVISGTAITYRLDGKYRLFTARLALDDTAEQEGDVRFEVIVDGKSRFISDVVRRQKPGTEPPRIPPINIAGAEHLTLKVHYVDDFVRDFANWLEPMLVR